MIRQYYVQTIAECYQRNLIDDPVSMTVHDKFLHGLDKEDFHEGFIALLSFFRMLYGDIARDPAGFDMVLKRNMDDGEEKAGEFDRSHASFIRIPNLLLAIGTRGELCPDSSLSINGGTLLMEATAMKITNLLALFTILQDYGFEIDGFNERVEPYNLLSFSYIDNKSLTVALKAMSEALSGLYKGDKNTPMNLYKGNMRYDKHYFYMVYSGLLEKEKVKKPQLTVGTIYQVLDIPSREIAIELHEAVAGVTKQDVQMGGNGYAYRGWKCIYTDTRDKRVLMTFNAYMDRLNVKLNLHHIDQYSHVIDKLPEKLRDIYDSYGFIDLTRETAANCLKLLKQEIICRSKY